MLFYEAVEEFPTTLTVIDVEATCWDKKEEGQINEIIEIGMAQIVNGKIEKLEPIIVQPHFSKVSEFCTSLTKITQEMVDAGELPKTAYPKMEKSFLGNTWASYGKYDLNMINKMADLYKISITLPPHHINVRELFANKILKSSDPAKAPSNPKDAMDQLGMAFEGQNHRGSDDAFNVSRLYLALVAK